MVGLFHIFISTLSSARFWKCKHQITFRVIYFSLLPPTRPHDMLEHVGEPGLGKRLLCEWCWEIVFNCLTWCTYCYCVKRTWVAYFFRKRLLCWEIVASCFNLVHILLLCETYLSRQLLIFTISQWYLPSVLIYKLWLYWIADRENHESFTLNFSITKPSSIGKIIADYIMYDGMPEPEGGHSYLCGWTLYLASTHLPMVRLPSRILSGYSCVYVCHKLESVQKTFVCELFGFTLHQY